MEWLAARYWTGGAQRLLRRAACAAAGRRAAAVEPEHLLWALVMDEGRAGVALEEAGISPATLEDLDAELAALTLEAIDPAVPHAVWNPIVEALAHEARLLAFQAGAVDEAGTDHWLQAFLRSDTAAARWLNDRTTTLTAAPTVAVPDTLSDANSPLPLQEHLELRERVPSNRYELYRILDAAANRAREGLRVLEDYARFGANDRHLAERLKQTRHELAESLQILPPEWLLACRDTQGDVGTAIETRREYVRHDLQDVLTAACKRAQEALRTLEEYGKVVSGSVSRRFEQLRYRVYTLEKVLLRTGALPTRLARERLYLLLTEAACVGGVTITLRAALSAGVRLFQVREKGLTDRALLQHCRLLRKWTRDHDALLIINDRPDIAALCDADGVHVGQDECTVADARQILGPDRLVGVSTHSIEQARAAVLEGADYLGVGPTFPSGTKTFTEFPGLALVKAVAEEITLPWFAIGGIDETNLPRVLEAGACRVAVTRAISGSSTPREQAASLLSRLHQAADQVGGQDSR